MRATLHERLLPGQGELALVSLLDDLEATGTAAPYGVEVFSDLLYELPPAEIGRRAGSSLRSLLDHG
jgi:hypothetical protein